MSAHVYKYCAVSWWMYSHGSKLCTLHSAHKILSLKEKQRPEYIYMIQAGWPIPVFVPLDLVCNSTQNAAIMRRKDEPLGILGL